MNNFTENTDIESNNDNTKAVPASNMANRLNSGYATAIDTAMSDEEEAIFEEMRQKHQRHEQYVKRKFITLTVAYIVLAVSFGIFVWYAITHFQWQPFRLRL